MKTSLVGFRSCIEFRSRWLRRWVVGAAVLLSGSAAYAQSVSLSTPGGQAGSSGLVNNATGTQARFNLPKGLASDGTTIYIADSTNNAIRKQVIATGEVTTLATGFNAPAGVAVDGSGNVYVADSSNHVIRKVTSGGVVSLLAGSSGTSGISSAISVTTANARFSSPQGVAVNSAGTYVYVADTLNNVVRRIDVGGDAVTEIATGFRPWGLALNAAGTMLYVTDYIGHTIRSINLSSGNALTTVAGTLNTPGRTDSPALFQFPQAITVDSAGDLYVADTLNNSIRKISGSTVTTIAGSTDGIAGSADAVGTSARFSGPAGIVATAVNSLFIADTNNHTIRRAVPVGGGGAPVITSASSTTFVVGQASSFTITATGTPAPTFAQTSGTFPPWAILNTNTGVISGTPPNTSGSPFTFGITATNGVAPAATQSFTLTINMTETAPTISTQPTSSVVQVGQTATFTAAANGSPTPSLRWQRQPAGTSGFVDLTNDGTYGGTTTGTLTITAAAAGMTGDQFRMVATNTVGSNPASATTNAVTLTVNIGTSISTFAGTAGLAGSTDATGTAARFNTPASIAIDTSGNFYVADAANSVIRKITSGGVVTTLAGFPGANGNSDGQGTSARFNGPSGVAVDQLGNVFVADTYNHTIRLITPGGSVTTLAGLANNPGNANGTGSAARFSFPSSIALDASGTAYVTDSSNHTIRVVTGGGSVSTLAGTAGLSGTSDGNGSSARFYFPNGIAFAGSGIFYVADSNNHTIRRVTTAGDVLTVAGGAGTSGSTDANGTSARFNQPVGVGVDTSGNIFVADTYNNTIRRISTLGDVTTIAGAVGQPGSVDGIGGEARFNQPFAVAVTSAGNLYIADTRNHTIRRSGSTTAPGIVTQPQNRTVPTGGTTTFTVVATGVPAPSYQWQRQPAGTSEFVNLGNDSTYSGVTTATLTVANVLALADGDQFRVVVSNGISPAAVSDGATLTIGVAPVITSAATATFRATQAGTFTVTATGTPTPTFSLSGQPVWLSIAAGSGVLSGTPPESAVGQVNFTVIANNGGTSTQAFTLVVEPGVVPPTIQTQPAAVAVSPGQSAAFSVVAQGTAPLSYQWFKNGAAINGATSATFSVANAQVENAANYSVRVTNAAGSTLSNNALLTVNTVPTFTTHPRTQSVLAGGTVTFSVTVTGGTAFNYQWRRNGVAIIGANGASFTIQAVTGADSGLYDVLVGNSVGTAVSSPAELSIVTTPVAPVITSQPAGRTVLAGASTALSVVATGVPAPTYQWRRNGADLPGVVGPTLVFGSAQAGDAGVYQVVVTNGIGTVLSAPAVLQVAARSYAGYYFGTFSGGNGSFALFVRENNTGVFLGYLPGATAPVMSLAVTVSDSGAFLFSQGTIATAAGISGQPARAEALAPVVVSGAIGSDGALSGTVAGGASLSFGGARINDGVTAGVAGFYQAGAGTNATSVFAIVSPNGQSLVVAQSGTTFDGGLGSASSAGGITFASTRSTFTAVIQPTNGSVGGTLTGAIAATVTGASDAALQRQRLVNISSRARVATGDAVAIAGFVIAGEDSKPVLIRAVGPTLGAAPFSVPGALAAPRLELYRGATSLAVNTGIAANRAAIDAAGVQAGAFALGAAGTDAAIVTTLAPGNYTAIVSSATNTAGVALIEVYDLSAPAVGQKLLNIATRAAAGTNENTLIAGFVVPAGSTKRVLIRGVGPGLTPFGVTGVLAQPVLALLNGSTVVATNTNWNTSTDAALITTASAQVGAFGLANNDSALIATLAPGNYTAQVTGVGGATGVALIEVYELP
jgi:DNA-binding beta-propeller fold protein YncE